MRVGLFTKSWDGKYGLDSLFRRDGSSGMLDAIDMIKREMMPPFFGT